MKKILVTGANGLLGSSLVPKLLSLGFDVYTLSRSKGSSISICLTDSEQLYKELDKLSPDVIVNLVALTNVDECELNPNLSYLMNVKTVENIANWLKRSDNCHLIHISTDHLYDSPGRSKECDLKISNYYAYSKYCAELILSNTRSTIIRTNFFGKSKCSLRTSFTDWIYKSIHGGKEISVFNDIYFSPLSITTLCAIISEIINIGKTGTYNLGAINGISKSEFAFKFVKLLNMPTDKLSSVSSTITTQGAPRPKNMIMNSDLFFQNFEIDLPLIEDEIKLTSYNYIKVTS